MNDAEAIFDQADEVIEAAALALAREEIASGARVPHEVVGAWLWRLADGEAGLARSQPWKLHVGARPHRSARERAISTMNLKWR